MFNLTSIIGNNNSPMISVLEEKKKRKRNQSESSIRKYNKLSETATNRRRYFSQCSARTDIEYEKEAYYSNPVFELNSPQLPDLRFNTPNQTPIIQIPLESLQQYSHQYSTDQNTKSPIMEVQEDTPLFDLCSTSLTDAALSELIDYSTDRQTPEEDDMNKLEEIVKGIEIFGTNGDMQTTRKRKIMKQSPTQKRRRITTSSLNQQPCSPPINDAPSINHQPTSPTYQDDFLTTINREFPTLSHSMNNIMKEQESRKNKDIQDNRQLKQINFDLSDFRSFEKFKQQRTSSPVYLQRELPVMQDPVEYAFYNEQPAREPMRESPVCITRPSLPICHPQFYDWRDNYIEQWRQKEFNEISQSQNTSQPSLEQQEYDWRADYIEQWRQREFNEMAKSRKLCV